MNKNTLVAFILIFATVSFFMSPTYQRFYYEKILKQPYPGNEEKKQHGETMAKKETIAEAEAGAKTEPVKTEKAAPAPARDSAEKAPAGGDTILVETKTMLASICQRGALIVSLKMKGFRIDHRVENSAAAGNGEWVNLIPPGSPGGGQVAVNTASYDAQLFSLERSVPSKEIKVSGNDSAVVSFVYNDKNTGQALTKRFTFYADGYRIGFSAISDKLANSRITISWLSGIAESENTSQGIYQTEERKAHWSDGNSVGHVKAGRVSPKDFDDPPSGFQRWIGLTSKYFFVALVADSARDADLKINAREEKQPELKDGKKNKASGINYSLTYQYTPQGNEANFCIYAGPSKYNYLKKQDLKFEQMLFPVLSWVRYIFWADRWFPPIAEFLLWLLLMLYSAVKDYGVVILILTLLTRIVTYPLTKSSLKSMNRMKDIQPKINALRQKYKSNPKKMNEEMMALYKQEGVNPLNPGCLPIFLQMPVFIALYVVLNRAIELRGAGTVLLPWVHDLSRPEAVFSIERLIPGGIPMYGSNVAILPIIMAIITFFQNKMTIKDPNQKMMIYFMPVFMLVLFNNFPAGLVLYWTFSSGLQLLQQYYMERKKGKAAPAAAGKGR